MRPAKRYGATGLVVASALLLVALPAPASPAAKAASARRTTLSASEVVHAFARAGITMINPLLGAMQGAVSLTATNPPRGENIGASIYTTARAASAVFHGDSPAWVRSGVAAAIRGNVVVTVVPNVVLHDPKRRDAVPMPAAVAKSLAIMAADLAR